MKVKLSKEQIELAKELAKKRHEAKDISFRNAKRITNNFKKTLVEKYIHDNTHKPHFLGLLGEIAYAFVSDQQIDTNIYEVRDNGLDVGTAEVKTSTWMGEGVELKIPKKEFLARNPTKYILARVDENNFSTVELLGEISREDFIKHKIVKQYKPEAPVNYIVGTKHLKPIA